MFVFCLEVLKVINRPDKKVQVSMCLFLISHSPASLL